MTMIPCPGLPSMIYPCNGRISPDHALYCSDCKRKAKRLGLEVRTPKEIEAHRRKTANKRKEGNP